MSLCVGLLRAFGAAMFMLCASWLVVGVCVFPLSLAIRALCLEEVCQRACCLVSLCLCVWLLGLFLFNSVPVWTQMCLCVFKPVSVCQATCGTGFV